MKYDDASWHYDGNYPKDLPSENAATAIGMFLAWCIYNNFLADDLKEDAEDDIEKVLQGKMTGAQFLIMDCDEKFIDFFLSELGQQFANDYYENDSEFAKKVANYHVDYCNAFNEKAKKNGFEYKSIYHVEDTKENYDLISVIISERFNHWKENYMPKH
ncbi:hypothetical protein HBP49_12510 [Listeria welshimeri]|nr:hypothetical protein [Listeria welshimeri]